ncbi:MAG: hypothetical protein NC548_57125 [Lachnospiraceae bacterium]|nr:hypothetical protein [Lachnospiraceae bacterium]
MADNKIHIDDIGCLLERFFNGDTTRAEEKALEDYFLADEPIPAEYECYHDMFAWYASGMDEAKLPQAQAPRKWQWRKKAIIWWSSAAAILAAILAVGWNYNPSAQQPALYAETFVMRDGVIIEGESEIRADVEASIISGYCLEQEINARMGLIDNN